MGWVFSATPLLSSLICLLDWEGTHPPTADTDQRGACP